MSEEEVVLSPRYTDETLEDVDCDNLLRAWQQCSGRPPLRYFISPEERDGEHIFVAKVYSGVRQLGQGSGSNHAKAKKAAAAAALARFGINNKEELQAWKVTQGKANPRQRHRSILTLADRKEMGQRHAERRSQLGREMEGRVSECLEQMVNENLITAYRAHAPYTAEDREGCDFTVERQGRRVSFGVTISGRRNATAKIRHPEVVQMHFPWDIKPETIKAKVLNLFAESV